MNAFQSFSLCLLISLASTVHSAEKTAAIEFQALLSKMQVYSAQFSQIVYDDLGEELQASSGFAQVQRPGKLYWQSIEPFQAVTISNDSVLWHYDIDLEQVSRSTLSSDVSETPALILGGDLEALEKGFSISRIEKTDAAFRLTPKSEGGLFTSIEFHFDTSALLSSMSILDSLQQRTEITFSEAAINTDIDTSLFDFVVPEGVDLIDNDG